MFIRFYRTIIFVLALLSLTIAQAEQSVGLVLSGGGAKGIAHIGVIQALEENDIPIDYVAGTSMGAIVGGLYAAGYSPQEMMALIESKGFGYWSTGVIDPSLVYYYAKPESTPALASFNLDLKKDSTKVNSILPSSLINPLPMNFAFMELFSAYTAQCGGDFNRLFVPFRCVASDVYHKHKIVCRSGRLGDAIRASMTFPVVFHPIEMNGIPVYDGGIYDNFPVDVMREEFAPDIMIGVDVSTSNDKPHSNDIVVQLENMIIQNNNTELPAEDGIKLHVNCEKYNLLDFQQAKAIYRLGYDHAMSMMDSIKGRVANRMPQEARKLRRAVFKSKTPYLTFDSVSVEGANASQNHMLKYFFTKGRCDTFGIEQARDVYYRMITPGKLSNLMPRADYDEKTGLFDLRLKATVKNNFKLGIGGYVSSSTNSMLFVSAGYGTLSFNSLNADANAWIGQSYMAGVVNAKMAMRTSWPSQIVLQGVVSRQKMYDSDRAFYEDATTSATSSEAFARFKYIVGLGRGALIDFSVGYGRLSNRFYSDLEVIARERDRSTDNVGQLRLHYEHNTLDDMIYPSSGLNVKATAIGVCGYHCYYPMNDQAQKEKTQNDYWALLSASVKKYWPIGRDFALGVNASVVASSRKLLKNYGETVISLPVFNPTVSTYNRFNSAFRAPQYLSVGVSPIVKIGSAVQLRGEAYCFMPWRKVMANVDMDNDIYHTPCYGRWFRDPEFYGEVAAVMKLPFANLSAYANYATTPGGKWNVGISFGLFFLAPQFMQ